MRHNKDFCQCGCKKLVKAGNRYIIGHNRKVASDMERVCDLYIRRRCSPYEISKKLGYSINRIKRCLRQCGIELRNRIQSATLVVEKGKNYMQTKKGQKEHSQRMKGHSHNRIYEYNRAIFKTIDRKTAYLLGYICADGCVSKEGKLMFTTKDRILLKKINLVFKSNKPILNCTDRRYFKLEFRSHEIENDLSKLGIIPKKPFRVYPKNLPKTTRAHFIRGYFDGDGCFAYHISYNIYKSMITSSNYKILEWIHSILPTQKGTIYKRLPNCHELRYGFADTIRFGNFIYKDLRSVDIYLPRKFDQFKRIKQFAKDKRFQNLNFK